MTNCLNTGVSVPECSCRACLQAQIERHMPALLAAAAAQASGIEKANPELRPRSEPERRAA